MCTDIGIPPVWQYPTSMWQSTTIEVPMKPIAPMPMLLPSSLNSSSSVAIFGSGLRDPTTRRHEACLPSTIDVFRTAEPDSDDRRLTGKPAFAEANQRVEIEPPDAIDAVAGKQHAIVGAEQATFMHGSEFDPIGVGMKRIFDLGGADADIVVVIGAPKRVYAVRA